MIENKSSIIFKELGGLIFFLPWLIAFSIMLSNTNDQVCTGDMWNNSNTTLWMIASITVIQIVSFIIKMIQPYFSESKKTTLLIKSITFISNLVQVALSLTSFIKICQAYGSRESCPDLQNLILAYIIVFSIIIGLSCLVVCLSIIIIFISSRNLSKNAQLSEPISEPLSEPLSEPQQNNNSIQRKLSLCSICSIPRPESVDVEEEIQNEHQQNNNLIQRKLSSCSLGIAENVDVEKEIQNHDNIKDKDHIKYD